MNSIIQIQKWWRGNISRKEMKMLTDSMTLLCLERCIDEFNKTIAFEIEMNKLLKNKKIRLSNFPSHISENIVKFALFKKYGIMPNWDTKKGDLCIQINPHTTIQIEVKGSIDLCNGPPSFGPTENWDKIYFVDGIESHIKKYKIYEISLSNTSEKWKNMKVNKTQTYFEQCQQKRRPRLTFKEIQNQLGLNTCKLIFYGYLSELY